MKPRIKWDAETSKWTLTYGRTVMDQRVRSFRFWPLAISAAHSPDAQQWMEPTC